MRDLKNALIACVCTALLSIAGVAIWMVRDYLPIVGVILLVVLTGLTVLTLAYTVAHVYQKFTSYSHVPIAQYGSILHRGDEIHEFAPYHPPQQPRRIMPRDDDFYIDSDLEPEELPEQEELPALLPEMLTFAELLEQGIVQAALAQGKMLLGYEAATHRLRYGSWLDLYSAGNGGVSGSGKSTTTRFLLFQAVLAHAKLVMIDPHIGDPDESLSYQFSLLPPTIHQLRPCDGGVANVAKRIDWLNKEMLRRKRTGQKTPFLVFVIDEFNAVIRSFAKEERQRLTKLLLDIEQEGRKFGIFALLIGQRWSAQDLGGADIRSSLASKMAHRFSDEDQAVRFIGSKHGKKLLELETGHWLFYDTMGKTMEMVTPETLAGDGAVISSILTETTAETTRKPRETTLQFPETTGGKILSIAPGNHQETTETDEETTPETSRVEDLARQIVRLQATGMAKPEIMRQVWKVNPGGSDAYQQAQAEYQEVMQFIADQIGA